MRAVTIELGVCSLFPLCAGLAMLAFGCNAVLGNQPGELGSADAGASPPDAAPLPLLDATVAIDASDAAAPLVDAAPPPAEDAAFTPLAVDAGTLPTCGFGQKLCAGSCVAIDDPLFGCGETTCATCSLDRASATCAGSGCAIASCDPGYADCDQKAANGCETDLSQPAHCGTCNAKCPSASPDCAPTSDGFACTTGCTAGAPTLCGEQCVSLGSTLDDCGACGNACPTVANGQATCASGHCGFTCQADFHACGGACATDVSPSTCGASCAPCPTAANAIATCNGVSCGMACEPNFANCNGVSSDGCEVDLQTDPANCGACAHSCGHQACKSGTCAPPPPPPDAGPPPSDSGTSPIDAASSDAATIDAEVAD